MPGGDAFRAVRNPNRRTTMTIETTHPDVSFLHKGHVFKIWHNAPGWGLVIWAIPINDDDTLAETETVDVDLCNIEPGTKYLVESMIAIHRLGNVEEEGTQ